MRVANRPNAREARVAKRVPQSRTVFTDRRTLIAGTRRQMALDLGVTEQALQKIENGTGDASLFMCFVYAAYLGVNLSELFPDVLLEAESYLSRRKQLSVTGSL
jgi:DNA-binding XRE family transcriptional regulator